MSRTPTAAPADVARPLLITSDAELLDDLLRLGAAAGVELVAVPDVVAARSFWPAAPLILVGDDAARSAAVALSRTRTARRGAVVLVGRAGGDDRADDRWPRALAIGADQVCVLPDADSALLDLLAGCTELAAPAAAIIAIIGGRGGAGASSLAAALAVTAARQGARVTFVDADPLSGGADLLFAGESAAGARWSDFAEAQGRIPARALRDALPQVGELAVLSWDRAGWDAAGDEAAAPAEVAPTVVANVLDALGRANDLVVIDLPRRVDETTQVLLAAADRLLVVVPAEVRAAVAASRVAAATAPYAADARLVVRGPAPGGLRAADVAAAVGLPLAGEMRAQHDLARCLERGEPPAGRGAGPLARLSEALLAQLRDRPHEEERRWLA